MGGRLMLGPPPIMMARHPAASGGGEIDLATATHSRSSVATYIDAGDVLQEAAVDELRFDYRSNGIGAWLREGASTNRVAYYRDPTQWVLGGTVTLDSSTEADKAGGTNAGLFTGGAGDTIDAPLDTQPADSTIVSTAVWVRGSGTVRARTRAKDGTFVNGPDITLTGSDQRIDVQGDVLTGATLVRAGIEIRAAGTSVTVFGFQLEDQAFPTSDIITAGTAVTREADNLSMLAADVPEWLRSGVLEFDWYPLHAEDEPLERLHIFQELGGSLNGFRYLNGSNPILNVMGGSGVLLSHILTYSRHQGVTMRLDQQAGEVTVSGATTGNGTSTATADPWTSVDMDFAGVDGISAASYARISNIRQVL